MANQQTEEIKDLIQAELSEWATGFIGARKAFLASTVSKSGVLTDSMRSDIDRQSRQEAIELLISFAEHGRFLDMKPTAQDKYGRNAILRLVDWVERTGLSKFVRGWERIHGKRPIDDNKLLNRIAWGIVIRRTQGKYRRRIWWNKSKQAAITELFNEVASKLPPKISEQVSQSLKPK